jgi:6,7-dimethyl-8-ribityllumazine synthase
MNISTKVRVLEGVLVVGPDTRFAIIQSRFNQTVTDALAEGAVDTLIRHGVDPARIDVIRVPGAFEIPYAASLAHARGYAAVICVGAVVRGETPHFEYVAQHSTAGVAALNARGETPVVLGILTCDTMEQARDRAGGKAGNAGAHAALTALEMVSLRSRLATAASEG